MPPEGVSTAIISILKKAAADIMKIYVSGDFSVQSKSDNSPVTRADLQSELIIKEGLFRLTPGIPVISEESAVGLPADRAFPDDYWIVDPLDGTREFIKRNDEFCICLARITNGEPTLGCIYAPVTGKLWFAARGEGAFRIESNRTLQLPNQRDSAPLRVLKSRSHSGVEEATWLKKTAMEMPVEEEFQGSAIKFARIAEGSGDIYIKFGIINKWDVAAGALIVKESGGGIISLLSGNILPFDKPGNNVEPFMAYGYRIRDPLTLARIIPPR